MQTIYELCDKTGLDYEAFIAFAEYFNISEPAMIAALTYILSEKENSRSR